MTLMPQFREQLLDAAARRPERRGFRLPRLRLGLGGPIMAAVPIAVVIAVVGVVVTLGHTGHSGTPGGRPTGRPGGDRAGAVPSASAAIAQLVSELGVLRRGHAPARLSAAACTGPCLPLSRTQIVDRSLVRTVLSGGTTVILAPVTHPAKTRSGRTAGLAVSEHGPKTHTAFTIGGGAGSLTEPVSPETIADHGIILLSYETGALDRATLVVPDGVTRVRLSQFEAVRSAGGTDTASIAPASAPVHDNVAVLALPGVTTTALHQTRRTVRGEGGAFSRSHCRVTAALYFVPVSARMTWSGATGSRTRTVHITLSAYSTTLLPHVSCHTH